MDDDIDNMSGSDFDDDEDPDKIEVPGRCFVFMFFLESKHFWIIIGGGKDLAAAAAIQESKLKQEDLMKNEIKPPLMNMSGNSKMPNLPMAYDMMRNPPSSKFGLKLLIVSFDGKM